MQIKQNPTTRLLSDSIAGVDSVSTFECLGEKVTDATLEIGPVEVDDDLPPDFWAGPRAVLVDGNGNVVQVVLFDAPCDFVPVELAL